MTSNIFQQKRYKMNTFEDAFRVAIEKQMNKKNRTVESYTLHPLNLIKMIKDTEENEASAVRKFSENADETLGKVKNNISGVSG